MLEPLIEFKKIKTFQGMEGEGMNGDVYVNGVKCFFMRNSGDGGCTDIDRYDNRMQPSIVIESNVQLVNAFIATIPDEVIKLQYQTPDGRNELIIKADLESYLDGKYNDYLTAKDIKKFEAKKIKLMETAFLVGVPNANTYNSFSIKKPLSTMPVPWLQMQYNAIKKKHCKGSVQFLNTNLQALGINL